MTCTTSSPGTPRANGFRMPAEWSPHRRCWMAWPCRKSLWGRHLAAAEAAYAAVARAIAGFEPVTMVARPEDTAAAGRRCGPEVTVLPLPLDDSWMRDVGPTFLVGDDGRLAGCDWRFNAWGGKETGYAADADVAARVLQHLGLPRYAAPLFAEGGGLHVDGEGTVLTTDSVLLNPNRNPGRTRAEVETVLCDYLGAEKVIWLPDGLTDDMTDGHVDNVACFFRPGGVLALTASPSDHRDHDRLAANLAILRRACDARGRPLEVVTVEAPSPVIEDGERLSLSYVNFYIANGAVIFPRFDVPEDAAARETVAKLFPGRRIVTVPARAICRGGGGIHCITQQEPAPLGT